MTENLYEITVVLDFILAVVIGYFALHNYNRAEKADKRLKIYKEHLSNTMEYIGVRIRQVEKNTWDKKPLNEIRERLVKLINFISTDEPE